MHDDSEIEEQPEDGCYMRGLFIEAARCDTLSALPAKLEEALDRLEVLPQDPLAYPNNFGRVQMVCGDKGAAAVEIRLAAGAAPDDPLPSGRGLCPQPVRYPNPKSPLGLEPETHLHSFRQNRPCSLKAWTHG